MNGEFDDEEIINVQESISKTNGTVLQRPFGICPSMRMESWDRRDVFEKLEVTLNHLHFIHCRDRTQSRWQRCHVFEVLLVNF
jgi:hypothetical protein